MKRELHSSLFNDGVLLLYTTSNGRGEEKEEATVSEATLKAKTTGKDEESMEDIVKRLQQKGCSRVMFSSLIEPRFQQMSSWRERNCLCLCWYISECGTKFSKDKTGVATF